MSLVDEEQHRERMLGRLREHLVRHRSPRAVLAWILTVTATAGFFCSMGMLKLGLDAMWLRYPLAVLVAWGVFLLLVRAWAEREREAMRLDEHLAGPVGGSPVTSRAPSWERLPRKSRWWEWVDPALLEAGEGCLVVLLFVAAAVALACAVGMLASLIAEADALLAEVLLDAVLISALYRRLRRMGPRWWLAGAVRQTRGPVVATMVFLMALGIIVHRSVPDAKSIGAVWKHVQSRPASPR